MRATLILVLLAAASNAFGGELFDTSQWKDHPPTATGSIPFGDLMSLGNNNEGAYLAYIDLFGTAKSLSVYKGTLDPTGAIDNALGPTWLHLVGSASSPPQDIGSGWTRYNLRDLKLPVVDPNTRTPSFEGGTGPYFRIQDGAFSTVEGFTQDPSKGSAEYFDVDTGNIPFDSLPVFRVIWETLDAPYVSRLGDANRDDKVDLSDFGILKKNFATRVDPFTVADFNGSGSVEATDFGILKQNFGWKASATVPEPASGILAVIALLVLWTAGHYPAACRGVT